VDWGTILKNTFLYLKIWTSAQSRARNGKAIRKHGKLEIKNLIEKVKTVQNENYTAFFLHWLKILAANLNWILMVEGVENGEKSQNSNKNCIKSLLNFEIIYIEMVI
jgi:hypothetical protein